MNTKKRRLFLPLIARPFSFFQHTNRNVYYFQGEEEEEEVKQPLLFLLLDILEWEYGDGGEIKRSSSSRFGLKTIRYSCTAVAVWLH